jgi:RHS repeat-associated protein
MHRITGWIRQSGKQTDRYDFGYDPLGQLLQATRTDSGGGVLSRAGSSYDDAGNRVSEQNGTALVHSEFDGANAIFSTEGGGPVRFAGQLSKPATLTVGGVAAQVDSRNRFETSVNLAPGPQTVPLVATDPVDQSTITRNYQVEVTAGSPRAYTRDENGNITGSSSPDGSGTPNTTYEWDAANRLVAINADAHRTEIEYDGVGRRVHLTEMENGFVTSEKRFLWCGDDLCEERAASGKLTKRFFSQGEERINAGATGLYFYTRDHLGSVREMTDWAGTVRARYDYTPWGSRVKTEGDLDCAFGFTGFYFHDSSGLNFSRTRAYDAVAAKWLSQDPIREAGGLNLYEYAVNDPVNRTDPSGLFVQSLLGWTTTAAVGTGIFLSLGVDAIVLLAVGAIVEQTTPEMFDPFFDSSLAVWDGLVGGPSAQSEMPPPRPPTRKCAPPGFPGDDPENHHRLPQEFKDWFEAQPRNLNIEDYTTEMPMQWHRGQGIGLHSQGYNAAWRQFITQNPAATQAQTLRFLNQIESAGGYGP